MEKKILPILLLAVSIIWLTTFFTDKSNVGKYNVILISLTDLRADHLGAYGYSRNTSPNLDNFAKESIVFENAFLQGSRSPMSFASLFTSQFPLTHGVVLINQTLPLSKITLAEVLKEKGYKTAAFVTSSYLSNQNGITQGFDIFYHGIDKLSETTTSIAKWITENKENKFFLFTEIYDTTFFHSPEPYEHYFDPTYTGILNNHSKFYFSLNPVEYPNAVLYKIKTDEGKSVIEEKNENIYLNQRDIGHIIAHYDGGVLYIDSFIGQFIEMLKDSSVYNNSVIIIFSDHGESLDDHINRDLMRNIQLTGHAQVYDEVIHTPLIFKHPDFQSAKISTQAQLIDLFPTILDFLNIPLDSQTRDQIQGKSLLSLMEGRKPNNFNEYVYGQSEAIQNHTFVRTKEWKLILWNDKFYVLYNLRNDPKETVNVIDRYPQVAEQLKRKLLEWHSKYQR